MKCEKIQNNFSIASMWTFSSSEGEHFCNLKISHTTDMRPSWRLPPHAEPWRHGLNLGMRPKQGANVLVWVLFSKLKSEFPLVVFHSTIWLNWYEFVSKVIVVQCLKVLGHYDNKILVGSWFWEGGNMNKGKTKELMVSKML